MKRAGAIHKEVSMLRRFIIIKKIIGGAKWIWQKVSGSAPLILVNAIESVIQSLKQHGKCTQPAGVWNTAITQYGKCEQNGTPTPSAPVDIMCNNGAMRLSPNLLSGMESKTLNGVTVGIDADGVITMSGTCTASANATVLADLPLVAGDYTLKVFDKQPQSSGTRIQAYNSAAGFNLTFSMDNDTTEVTGALTTDVGVTIRVRVDGGVTYDNYKIKPMFVKGSTAPSAFVAAGAVYADGTPETLTVRATGAETQTVTDVPTLLSVGDIKDEGEIINGIKTGKVGVKVLDGTEAWTLNGTMRYVLTISDMATLSGRTEGMCTHFSYAGSSANAGTYFLTSTRRLFVHTGVETVDDFQAWLASEYAAGTPVIVLYPLATPTTEQTTAYPQLVNAKYNTASVTAAVSDIQVTFTTGEQTAPTPYSPLPIVCNNGELKWNGTTVAAEGTPEVLTVSASGAEDQTASVEDLLAVGDNKDIEEITGGHVVRKVGVKVLNGTESVSASGAGWAIAIADKMRSKVAMLCSHYPYSSATMANAPDKSIISFSSQNIGIKDSSLTSTSAVQAFLAAQYDAGTPVIIIYPLADEVMESVEGQPLTTSVGTNVVSVTSNVDPVELEVEFAQSKS